MGCRGRGRARGLESTGHVTSGPSGGPGGRHSGHSPGQGLGRRRGDPGFRLRPRQGWHRWPHGAPPRALPGTHLQPDSKSRLKVASPPPPSPQPCAPNGSVSLASSRARPHTWTSQESFRNGSYPLAPGGEGKACLVTSFPLPPNCLGWGS